MAARTLLVMSKPPVPGRVKTRLLGELSAADAARLQAGFLEDLIAGVRGGRFEVVPVWALEPGESIPAWPPGGLRQREGDLGCRLAAAFETCRAGEAAAAVGSDHPELDAERIEEAFSRLAAGADVVFGPARDGGFYLLALRPEVATAESFAGIPWSTERTLAALESRFRAQGRAIDWLVEGEDVDTPEDLRRLAGRLALDRARCPRTAELLAELGWLPPGLEAPCAS